MAVIYRHLKPNGEVFYIGIGKNSKRAYTKSGRNRFWKYIFPKYPDYEVQILKSDLTWEDACELEIILIAHYGRSNLGRGTLCNLTDGGDGVSGNIHSCKGKPLSEEHKQKLRKPKELTPAYVKARSEHGKNLREKFNSRIKYICTKTLKTWGTLRECGKDIGIPEPTLSSYLNPDSRMKNISTIMMYETYLEKGVVPPDNKKQYKLKVVNIETKEVFNTARKAAQVAGEEENRFYRKIKGKSKNDTPFMLLSEYEEQYGKLILKQA